MRIAIIGKKQPFCGIVTYCRELAAALRERGHSVAFFHVHDAEARSGDAEALPCRLRIHLYMVPGRGAEAALAARLAAFRPDVVHANFALSTLDFALPELCARIQARLVATFHPAFDSRPTLPNRISNWTYRAYARTLGRCERVVIFCEAQRRRLIALGVRPDRIAVIPNGVDPLRYAPGPSRFREALQATTLLTYMGRLDPEKNVGALLAAFSRLERPPGTHLAIVGDGVLGARLRARHGRHPDVHFLGAIPDEARRIDVLRGSDLFVLPSSVEGLSLALLEAMACGAAPIATDAGADGEVIAGVGWVIDPTRVRRELSSALAQALAEPGRMAERGALARARVLARYDGRGNARMLEQLYMQACAGDGAWRAEAPHPPGVTMDAAGKPGRRAGD